MLSLEVPHPEISLLINLIENQVKLENNRFSEGGMAGRPIKYNIDYIVFFSIFLVTCSNSGICFYNNFLILFRAVTVF